MEETSVQRLARVLRALVLIAFVCNLLVMPLVPGLEQAPIRFSWCSGLCLVWRAYLRWSLCGSF